MTTDQRSTDPAADADSSSSRRDGATRADGRPRDSDHEAHLERSRRVWNRWSDWYGMSERDFEPIRERAISRLDLHPGDRVLEVGCGPGVNFASVRDKIGSEGRLVGVDYSQDMVENARERVKEHGWENVDVVRADATTVDLDERFDAAIATLSLSVMPDVRAVLETVRRHLVPGAPIIVVDVRPAPSGPLRLLNPLIWRFFRWYANWNPDENVLEALDDTLEECRVVETVMAGTAYTALCRTGERRADVQRADDSHR
ncbi:class I SAM-dependent methyltransferase [Natrarchaeobaculum aegyptiacum]|uniref:Methyltransferase type 11 n=1 Tax=Natrarchaeobaculum aegyptiacum TaxID=745377 RepID=A0A2Z2HUK3_9EURY|nr:methyltransferase domain-containing protein [Natrarchaeobaculum aegyptiacum]ARS89825.1 methyltransferase type 11 [Natrarchaeobaculum aegyptiacum]